MKEQKCVRFVAAKNVDSIVLSMYTSRSKKINSNQEEEEKMKLKRLVSVVAFLLVSGLVLFRSEVCLSEEVGKDKPNALKVVVEKTLGKGAKILRTENTENSPVPNWKQMRVWIESVYGETPVLFYSSEDGKFIVAGSIFNESGENLTQRDVGKTIPKVIEKGRMELNENYLIGNKDAQIAVVLWIGADAYSKQLFEMFSELFKKNKDKISLYIKFYPRSEPDAEKMKAVTCFKGEALIGALQTLYTAVPGWGTKEDLDAFKKTGDPGACNDELVLKDLQLAAYHKLPSHPVAVINNILLTDKATKENIMKITGTQLD